MMSSFLLVSLNMNAIPSELTLLQIINKLHEIAKGEGDACAIAISRMKEQHRSR